MTLERNQEEYLLRLARNSIEEGLGIPTGPDTAKESIPEWARVPSGAFVTIKESGELRGCIGSMAARESLYKTIVGMAKAAAFEDPRFEPLTAGELPLIRIEISVLTPMEPIEDTGMIEVGRHGVYVSSGHRSGVFLPQVPVEWGWDRDTYLRQLMRKAGLPESALTDPLTRFWIFEALVFAEGD